MALASGLGTPIKIDFNTLRVSRGKFTRVCVEIDLTKPVVGRVCVEGKWLFVKYEGLHIICAKCGCYGHHARNCNPIPEKQTNTDDGRAPPDTASPVTEAMKMISLIVREQDSTRRPDSRIGKIDEISRNSHGEWLVVQQRSKMKSKKDPQIKGKNLE